ncbi:MAG: SRPBCC family protein [Bacteroidota bacterium]
MKTTITKTFHVEDTVDNVWGLLSDPRQVVTCVPGASLTEEIDDNNFKGTVSLKFGPVKAVYNGEITIEEKNVDTHQMRLKGKGLDAKGKGSADMVMNGSVSAKEGGAEVDYSMEVSVTGKLAQFGSRLITDVSNQLFDQFVGNFKDKLAESSAPKETLAESGTKETYPSDAKAEQVMRPEPEDNAVNAFSILWGVIKAFFKRLFGGGK